MLDPPVVRAPPQQDVLTRSPRDVLFELLCHVHLKDILSLRCVCRVFRELTMSRALWVERLRILARNEIMIPTHMICDLDDPRIGAEELERIVSAHIRIPSALLKTPALLNPSRILKNTFSSPNVFVKLLPGGRFIVTGALENPGESLTSILSLWDLNAEKALVSSVSFQRPLIECYFSSTNDCSAVRLAVVSGNRLFAYDISVVEIRWPTERSGFPTMQRVAGLNGIYVQPQRLAIEDEMVCFHSGTFLILWNWNTGRIRSGVGPHTEQYGLVLRPPHALLHNSLMGSLTVVNLPTTRMSQLHQVSETYEHLPTFDAYTIHGWRPSSMTRSTHFATCSLGTTYRTSELRIYEWAQLRDQTCPPPTLLSNISVPDVEDFYSVIIHCIAGDAFIVVCPPSSGEDNKAHVRVAMPDGNVVSNKLPFGEGMQWQSVDKLLMCPFAGSLLVVTATSIMVFDL